MKTNNSKFHVVYLQMRFILTLIITKLNYSTHMEVVEVTALTYKINSNNNNTYQLSSNS